MTNQDESVPLTIDMKLASRKIHNLANASVNLKLVVLLSDKLLYAKAIAGFFPVFKTLEENAKKSALHGELKYVQPLLPALERATALSHDLKHYLGCVCVVSSHAHLSNIPHPYCFVIPPPPPLHPVMLPSTLSRNKPPRLCKPMSHTCSHCMHVIPGCYWHMCGRSTVHSPVGVKPFARWWSKLFRKRRRGVLRCLTLASTRCGWGVGGVGGRVGGKQGSCK